MLRRAVGLYTCRKNRQNGNGRKENVEAAVARITTTNALFILDRGFGNFGICKMFEQQGHRYCIRPSTRISSFATMAMTSAASDFITLWQPSEKERSNCAGHGQDAGAIRVRVSKVVLGTGETELLVSNLFDMDEVTAIEMKKLYFMRWGVEEGIKKLKPKMKLEHFGCKKMEGVYQEFHAHIFMLNLVSILGNEAMQSIEEKTIKRKHKYKYNWQNAYRFVRDKIVALINNTQVRKTLKSLLEEIALSPVAIIPDRAFSREKQSSRKSRHFQCYK